MFQPSSFRVVIDGDTEPLANKIRDIDIKLKATGDGAAAAEKQIQNITTATTQNINTTATYARNTLGGIGSAMQQKQHELQALQQQILSRGVAVDKLMLSWMSKATELIQYISRELEILDTKFVVTQAQLSKMTDRVDKYVEREKQLLNESLQVQHVVEGRVQQGTLQIRKLERDSQWTYRRAMLVVNRGMDALQFMSAITGQQIDLHYFTMIMMATSAVHQLTTESVIFAGMGRWEMAARIMSLLPIATSLIMFQQQEQQKARMMMQESLDNASKKTLAQIGD